MRVFGGTGLGGLFAEQFGLGCLDAAMKDPDELFGFGEDEKKGGIVRSPALALDEPSPGRVSRSSFKQIFNLWMKSSRDSADSASPWLG